jgi:hypothetical protein
MDFKEASTNALKGLHEAVRAAMMADDRHAGPKKPHGVREYRDWRQWSDAIEAELRRRNEHFDPIRW